VKQILARVDDSYTEEEEELEASQTKHARLKRKQLSWFRVVVLVGTTNPMNIHMHRMLMQDM
jgi:hypothetical protein